LAVYHWSIDEKRLRKDAHIAIPVDEFARHIKEKISSLRESSDTQYREITLS